MRKLLLVAGLAGLVGVFSACSDPDHYENRGSDPVGGRSNGPAPAAGKSNSDDAGAGGAVDVDQGQGPLVTITSPAAAAEPSEGVLSEPTVTVLCSAEKGAAAAVDPASVTIYLLGADDTELQKKAATSTGEADEYGADFVLETVPSGVVSFRCVASDKDKNQGSNTISTFVDHGPTITVTSPEPDSAHPLQGGLSIDFSVEPAELSDGDDGAEVDTVTFSLDNKQVELEQVSAGHYQATLFLDDTNEWPQIPTGAVNIEATNKRKPAPVTASKSYSIVVDGTGPVIAIQSPSPQKVVGGKVTLQFTVSDTGSGVDETTVNVTLAAGDKARFYDPKQGFARDKEKYSFTFDSKAIEPFNKVQTTINIRATDLVGNESASGASLQLYLDNVPPKVDLDPRDIRTVDGAKCSAAFDPVGFRALNDLEGQLDADPVSRIDWFRAFVYEETNSIPNQQIFYHSGTDQSQVRLYIQADPENAEVPLLVNKNPLQDDTCDDIGGIDKLDGAPVFSALKPLTVSGGPLYGKDSGKEPLVSDACLQPENTAALLCPAHSSDLWFAPKHPIGEPLIYVVGTPMNNDESCSGLDLEFVSVNQPEGWVCAAARVMDKAGNVGISPPLRICVDDLETPEQPACRVSSTTPPKCTDGCTPPARGGNIVFDPQ